METSEHDLTFLHKDEFESRYSTAFEYPAIIEVTDELQVIVSNRELAQFESVDDLIARLDSLVSPK